ncbi:F1F0-ATPase putative regulatory protein IF1 [Cavenderia fasciculata]|uniref:F1F0-ATPase putative regulatory protein IF1 n=1 Tax=Cavenderia fasciculata TaxID=261658 RepID=F4PVV6_CACFS|nr:F1F0-ATPase putative regulatory protein IF1 [Cavenderia fasciculata]EGG20120.1 F1F0-ATPase putative regulatory protein IF1 [Cavenderia fasciculata]|eukprot:XP_004367103.1 F1F0-ATPase putative regulatory protein IF1 [Cavenderia fasciculata]
MSLLVRTIQRTSILAPRMGSTAFILRAKDNLKEREDALEEQYVKEKEKDDLRKLKDKLTKDEAKKVDTSSVQGVQRSKKEIDSEIVSLEKKVKELQDQISKLKKK